MTDHEFTPFPKIARLNRTIFITEKIDGTNAAVVVTDEGDVYAQSRKRVITPESDNFGFARFVAEREADLARALGPGVHFGEWYGSGIQRGYGLRDGEKYFALFNVDRWAGAEFLPDHVTVVPTLAVTASHMALDVRHQLTRLSGHGSFVTGGDGFDRPEGIVLYHTAARQFFKVTLENDEIPKALAT